MRSLYSLGCDVAFFVLVILTAWLLAKLEIQIEGANGWAADLPTWQVNNRWTQIIFGDRPLTGYHLYFWLFVLAIVHVAMIGRWSVRMEMVTLSFCILMWAFEDFFWFVFNPYYGIAKYKPEFISWHPHWWGPMPREFYFYFGVGIVLYVLGVMKKSLVGWVGSPPW